MRLVAWNANHNNRRRTSEQNLELLQVLRPDVVVLSETAKPVGSADTGWSGQSEGYPGLWVTARPGLQLRPHAANHSAAPLMAGYSVGGDLEFDLLAIWPVQRKGEWTYAKVLDSAVRLYSDLLSGPRAIMAGDLNSNSRVSGQESSHPRFVAAAEQLGMVSAYHYLSGEQHGDESVRTYRHDSLRSFHIDYCFVSRRLVDSVNFSAANTERWLVLSDHSPLILDAPDCLLRPSRDGRS